MNGEELIEALESSRLRLLEAIEPLDDAELLQPGVVGTLSVRDILLLITVWEAELITGLMRLDQGRKPEHLLAALARPEQYSEQRLAENMARTLDRIFDDFQGTYFQLEEWIESFSNRDLTDPNRYQWLNGRPLWQIIRDASFGLLGEYLDDVESYATAMIHGGNGEVPSNDVGFGSNGYDRE